MTSGLCVACVEQQNVAISERCGNFASVLSPGLNILPWPFVGIAGTLSLRIQQLDVVCETKTKDNVFVQVAVSVQYRVLPEKVYDAFYRKFNRTHTTVEQPRNPQN